MHSAAPFNSSMILPGKWTNYPAAHTARSATVCNSPGSRPKPSPLAWNRSAPWPYWDVVTAITERPSDGRVIRAAAELTPGEQISTRFARGKSISRVEKIEE